MILADLDMVLILRIERLTIVIGVVGLLIAAAVVFVGLRIRPK
jgi:hypothetical protein